MERQSIGIFTELLSKARRLNLNGKYYDKNDRMRRGKKDKACTRTDKSKHPTLPIYKFIHTHSTQMQIQIGIYHICDRVKCDNITKRTHKSNNLCTENMLVYASLALSNL